MQHSERTGGQHSVRAGGQHSVRAGGQHSVQAAEMDNNLMNFVKGVLNDNLLIDTDGYVYST